MPFVIESTTVARPTLYNRNLARPAERYPPFFTMKWTKEEERILRENYPDSSIQKLMKMINRKRSAIEGKAARAGLKKSKEYMKKLTQKRVERLDKFGKDTRFQPGFTPHNKGQKMSPERYKASYPTMFKKGNTSHNEKKDGDISIYERNGRKFKYIRISANNWARLHRLVWEEAHGKIPDDHLIRFKNGDSLDVRLSNLQCIPKSEHMRGNSIHNYPDELKEVIFLNARIKKIIKEHGKK